mmetsp:Transcript_37366/g.80466  ORF Transcript_37366/g.80466 Transcript_37366/m.80466 type:complete len:245 (+) Transcript_37366:33-767(+)
MDEKCPMMAETSLEDKAIAEGAPRIKFGCHTSKESLAERLSSGMLAEFRGTCEVLANACVLLEQMGAAPILADGLVAGNCAAVLRDNDEEMLLVTRSGKAAGKHPTEQDFVTVQSFDANAWSCNFCGYPEMRPTSDTPLHWAALMRAQRTFGWSERPLVTLHGHALAEKEGLRIAEQLELPISHDETLFSTPEDVEALMTLFKSFPYPQHKVFIRRGHGFLILAESVEAAVQELKNLEPHFEKR